MHNQDFLILATESVAFIPHTVTAVEKDASYHVQIVAGYNHIKHSGTGTGGKMSLNSVVAIFSAHKCCL
ncbi:MAG TPA: hypothetical protein VFA09_12395 [Ktedonobacteraceae bacterium]|nr:hypothetical protein [Ktedonobacteraceae bacterium]